ncbi:MAG: alanyl-tRNA synthetase [Limisphaerales bacterium]|nr:MAG: alanyl-tRNA synthetase [Limisphaerales bacterium]KAG0509408.1 MAG: alanyl-tRNA synthetase [Limisphaerales bacterium]
MMTSTQIRQSFLDFFRSKQHTIVPSSSLLPDSPNLLFTNAGMNQFVPIFLNETKCPYSPGRAADTQKCIRAGGKHNDLDDVGLDTYHHTFFEMLGNWSFGDYFKQEAISWAWELVIEVWKFPPQRLYATVYNPDKTKGDPSEFDQEAWDIWAAKFRSVGLDPAVHIVTGGKKDNFWMMGETGPCGPCSELHVDLTPAGDTKGALVNKGTAECIEIWNNVFIQFNANPDGTFSPLPAKHVDTGMGFERVTSIMQGTKMFSDFANAKISNYETDIFRPIFDELEKMSGKQYGSTLPKSGSTGDTEQEKVDIAFRVIGDHIRTLSFAIADGIQPGNTDRNYVLRRILRRAVRYGRTLGFHEPFFYKLVDVLAATMGDVFPEIRTRKQHVKDVLKLEEESFNKTLDNGIGLFEGAIQAHNSKLEFEWQRNAPSGGTSMRLHGKEPLDVITWERSKSDVAVSQITGQFAFLLYDTYGFPLDLTELMARERGLTVDVAGFNALMEEQKARARAAQKKTVIELSQIETKTPTRFLGYDALETPARVLEVVGLKDKTAVVLDTSTCYAEMGGQLGDTGELTGSGQLWRVVNTQKSGNTWLHILGAAADSSLSPIPHSPSPDDAPAVGSTVTLSVDRARRSAIERHHTVTHLLHWALHEVVSQEASQKGSFVGPDKLTFDFNSAALTPAQIADIEKLVNERIVENAGVSWTEVPHADVKGRKDVMQFFGDKYGDTVRVVQIGGAANQLNGYSMELCGGTHTRATGEIGLFRIVGENAIAAGVRRIEAVAGLTAFDAMRLDRELIRTVAGKVNSPIHELEKKIELVLAQQKELEKQLKLAVARNASNAASELLSRAHDVNGTPLITHNLGDADGEFLQAVVDALKSRFKGVIVLGGGAGGAVTLIASVSPDFTAKAQAGKIIQQIAPIVGGKGGGKPDNARGGGKDASKLDEALAKVKSLLG